LTDNNNESRIRSAIPSYRQNSVSSYSNLEFQYDTDKLRQENAYRIQGQPFPLKINQFNWGACILPLIWGVFNNSPIALLSFVFVFIPWIGMFLGIAFSIYCGMKGNEWAWQNKEWENIYQFHRTQRNWAKWAILYELLIFSGMILIGSRIINNIESFVKI